MHRWQLQEAKARLSELVQAAIQKGPQEISVRGKPTVVVVSCHDFEQLSKQKPRFVDLIRSSPLAEEPLEISRSDSLTRDVDL